MRVAIGVDMGGTAAKLGVVTESGEILRSAKEPMLHDIPAEALMANVVGALRDLVGWTAEQGIVPIGMGVSVCGYMEPDGERPDYINVHSLDHYPLKKRLTDEFGLPAVLDNDMNCGALGEYHFGAGRGVERLMVMTVGYGIGMGAILDGQVVRISGGTTGNPGHVIVEPNGPVCVAGCRGCLESLTSAGPISRRAEDMARSQRKTILSDMLAEKGSLTPEDLYHAAEAGDQPAQEIWQQVGEWLGRGLAAWVEIFGPEVVLVGGGVAGAGHWLIDPMEQEMRQVGEPYFTRRVREVRLVERGREATMLGAASLVLFPEYAPRYRS
jgi:glucokinase